MLTIERKTELLIKLAAGPRGAMLPRPGSMPFSGGGSSPVGGSIGRRAPRPGSAPFSGGGKPPAVKPAAAKRLVAKPLVGTSVRRAKRGVVNSTPGKNVAAVSGTLAPGSPSPQISSPRIQTVNPRDQPRPGQQMVGSQFAKRRRKPAGSGLPSPINAGKSNQAIAGAIGDMGDAKQLHTANRAEYKADRNALVARNQRKLRSPYNQVAGK